MTTWILLRGLMRESRHWGDFQPRFKQTLPAQQVITLDFPGNGSLYAQNSATHIADMVRYARKHLRQQNLKPPYCILALSLGAMVAVAWSEQHPEELERMVLINTSLAPYNPFYFRLRPQNYIKFPLLLLGNATQREQLILKLTSTRYKTEKMAQIVEQWVSYAQQFPITRRNILRQLSAAARYRASSQIPSVPILLLAGQQDQLVNTRCSLTLAQKWNCAIKIHPNAGHDLPLDDGCWVIQQIQEWLNP